ncbi:MAG TPA: OmpA family protein [Acidimicrobiales bacterium]|jgi:outer membrane protein OmpA-like peptidoglycan-associated protein|nr:OmpA family protein [Acidimicrobiales bacterium]
MTRRRDLATAVPVVALLAVVSTAALPGPPATAPPPVPPPPAVTTTSAPPAQPAEVQQIIDDLDAVESAAGLVVPLPERVLFDFDKAEVRDDAKPTLEKVATLLAYYGGSKVEVRGHTDDVGEPEFNLALSGRRAAAVRDYLVGVSGVTAERFVVKALGETEPLVPNDSAEHRQQNRRVEVVVLG